MMKYEQFRSKIKSSVVAQTTCYGHTISETANGFFVDNNQQKFDSLEEARLYIKQQKIQQDIYKEIEQELYEMSDNKIADYIQKHYGNIRITDTLVESYVELASSKLFTTDPVAHDIRRSNTVDRLVEGHLDCVLDDGTVVIVSEQTMDHINKVFGQHPDVTGHIRKNKENFLNVLNQLEG